MRKCAWCPSAIPETARSDARYCCQQCRQTAFRLRRRRATAVAHAGVLRFAYADPPYPGTAKRYYQHEPDYGGEVDHAELVARLDGSGYDGWALSTSAKALREVLPLCQPGARVCPWVKPGGVPRTTNGLHNCWEALIVVGGRQRQPGARDWLRAHPARGGGQLPGRKPIAFCAWLFDCLGMVPGDQLDDLFPGSGIVTRAWSELSSRPSAAVVAGGGRRQVSLLEDCDASLLEDCDASPLQAGDSGDQRSWTTAAKV